MARQIFEKYNYELTKLNNFNDETASGYFKRFNDRTDYR